MSTLINVFQLFRWITSDFVQTLIEKFFLSLKNYCSQPVCIQIAPEVKLCNKMKQLVRNYYCYFVFVNKIHDGGVMDPTSGDKANESEKLNSHPKSIQHFKYLLDILDRKDYFEFYSREAN